VRLRRRPVSSSLVFWVAAIALAAVTGTVLAGLVHRAHQTVSRYGHQQAVVVAIRKVAAGQVLRPGDVEVRAMPAAFLPAGALPVPPIGRTVVVPLFPGEVVLGAKVAPKGAVWRGGPAAPGNPGSGGAHG
jgi:Flp pilus assembly protein CpaB